MQQIETFHVGRFRGLTRLTLEGAGRVNLIVGGNNSGKTSLLEAIAVYAAPLDVSEWAAIARMREVRFSPIGLNVGLSTGDAIRWLFPQESDEDWAKAERQLFIEADGRSPIRTLAARCIPIRGIPPEPRYRTARAGIERSIEEEEGWHLSIAVVAERAEVSETDQFNFGLEVEEHGARQSINLDLDFWPSTGLRTVARHPRPLIKSATLSPYSHRNQPLQIRMLSRVISSGEKLGLIRLLQGVDPDLEDIDIITDHSGQPLLTAVLRGGRRVPVTVLGDGFRRALAIAIAMSQVRGGLLMIDEIETAMHVSALDTLFPWLMEISAEQNVQVFATTHSLEAIQAITNATSRANHDSLTAYHLPDKASKTAGPKRYSAGMLSRLVRDRGLDIR